MHTVIIVVHLLIVLAMIGLVLLQRSEGGGLGMGSGGGGFMTTRGTTNVLSRATAILAAAFFATSMILSIVAGMDRRPTSILNTGAPVAPGSAPTAPLGSGSGGVFDALKQQGGQPPAAPAPQPSGPQVPQSQ